MSNSGSPFSQNRFPLGRLTLAFGALLLAGLPVAASQETRGETGPPPAVTVSVRLASVPSARRLTVTGVERLTRPNGETVLADGGTVECRLADGQVELSSPELEFRTRTPVRLEGTRLILRTGSFQCAYPEALEVSAAREGLNVTNRCGLERYVEGVLVGECPARFATEAIRALAICVRTYSFRKAILNRLPLCDTTHCQVYRGSDRLPASIAEAVDATRGILATHDGQPIDAVYCADCGGHTEANETAWRNSRPLPYLRPVPDFDEAGKAFCSEGRSHTWSVSLSWSRLLAMFGHTKREAKPDNSQPELVVHESTTAGRVSKIGLAISSGAMNLLKGSITGWDLRQKLGPAVLKSLRFVVLPQNDGVQLHGVGFGHGVGLCQWGAHGHALAGQKFEEILKHYYTGIQLEPLTAASLTLVPQRPSPSG